MGRRGLPIATLFLVFYWLIVFYHFVALLLSSFVTCIFGSDVH